jgi:hypothetical protein
MIQKYVIQNPKWIDPATRPNIISEPELGLHKQCLGQKPTGKTFVAKLIDIIDEDILVFENSKGERMRNRACNLLRLAVV